jgi:hypothetical protein
VVPPPETSPSEVKNSSCPLLTPASLVARVRHRFRLVQGPFRWHPIPACRRSETCTRELVPATGDLQQSIRCAFLETLRSQHTNSLRHPGTSQTRDSACVDATSARMLKLAESCRSLTGELEWRPLASKWRESKPIRTFMKSGLFG